MQPSLLAPLPQVWSASNRTTPLGARNVRVRPLREFEIEHPDAQIWCVCSTSMGLLEGDPAAMSCDCCSA